MKIWIARHGQTDLNKRKMMQGLTDCPLNERGLEQARQSRRNIGDIHFDAVYASPLKRAQQTAAIIGNVDDFLLGAAEDLSCAAYGGKDRIDEGESSLIPVRGGIEGL